jgi:transcriptional/translational regulatory protein YebC/TACO1
MPEYDLEVEEISWVPQVYVKLTNEDDIANFEKFLAMAEDCEDIQHVYHNVEL